MDDWNGAPSMNEAAIIRAVNCAQEQWPGYANKVPAAMLSDAITAYVAALAPQPKTRHSDAAWEIASRYSWVLASETRDLAAAIDRAIADAVAKATEPQP